MRLENAAVITSCQRLSICKGIIFFSVFTVLAATNALAQGDSRQRSAKSVVQVTCRRAGSAESGTGFVWSKPTYVVTALHVVAGCDRITVYSESQKDARDARVIAVHLESDLALLELDSELGLTPLKHATLQPNLTAEHEIWGYPHSIPAMKSDDIRFSRGLEETQTLKSIFRSSEQFERELGKQGYPKLTAQILRLSSIIQPGHSGAPIFDQDGLVVGIGDGGLRSGVARLNWAIPTRVYLPQLKISKDSIPAARSLQSSLFGASLEVSEMPGAFSDSLQSFTPETVSFGEQQTLQKTWTTSLTTLLWLATAKKVQDFKAWSERFSKKTDSRFLSLVISNMINPAATKNLSEHFLLPDHKSLEELPYTAIDVYEDFATGAAVAIPSGVSFRYDERAGLLLAQSESQQLEMIVQIVHNKTWERGVQAKDAFEAYLEQLNEGLAWQAESDEPDVSEYDEREAFWKLEKSRFVLDNGGRKHLQMHGTLTIDDNDFLGVAVVVRDPYAFPAKDWLNFFMMRACAKFASFSIR